MHRDSLSSRLFDTQIMMGRDLRSNQSEMLLLEGGSRCRRGHLDWKVILNRGGDDQCHRKQSKQSVLYSCTSRCLGLNNLKVDELVGSTLFLRSAEWRQSTEARMTLLLKCVLSSESQNHPWALSITVITTEHSCQIMYDFYFELVLVVS